MARKLNFPSLELYLTNPHLEATHAEQTFSHPKLAIKQIRVYVK